MAGLPQISRLLRKSFLKKDVYNYVGKIKNTRYLNYLSREYEEANDPTPYFFNKDVQQSLLKLIRMEPQKIFRKRGVGVLEDDQFEFLTDEQLKEKLQEMHNKAVKLMQFPPAVVVRKPKHKVLSVDPALIGYDSSKFVFTDITYGLKDIHRLIVVRDPDGTLREADWTERDRINQVYFPKKYRQLKIPQLFKDSYFEDILNRREYVFILDLACQQFEPDDPEYQRVTSITYQHINDHNEFEKLRSTRHFGSMTFFLLWMKEIDNLLLDLIETCHIQEAKILIELFNELHKVTTSKSQDVELIEEYMKNHSNKKASLELALQATKDFLSEKESIEKGIQKAHGH